MKLTVEHGLPFLPVNVIYRNSRLEIPKVLLDTGSASTILSADLLAQIKLVPQPDDQLHKVIGIGGSEVVFSRKIDLLEVGEQRIADFEIEIGGMDYNFEINGILGMDFLLKTNACIDFSNLTIDLM